MFTSDFKFATKKGIDPVSQLLARTKLGSCVQLPTPVGIVPVRKLSPWYNTASVSLCTQQMGNRPRQVIASNMKMDEVVETNNGFRDNAR